MQEKSNLIQMVRMLLNEDVSLYYQLDQRQQEFLLLNSLWMMQNLKVINMNKHKETRIPHQINHYVSLKEIYR